MPIQFECPNCRARYDVAEDMVGKTILCRECEQRVAVQISAGKAGGARPPSSPGGGPTRRKAILYVLSGVVPAALVAGLGTYYWNHPLPWEELPRRRPKPPDGNETAEGQPAEGQPADGQTGGRRGGRGGRRRPKQENPPQ